MESNEEIYWIWYALSMGYASERAISLLSEYRSPRIIYKLTNDKLDRIGDLDAGELEALKNKDLNKAIKIHNDCYDLGIRIISVNCKQYPPKLKNIYSAPVILYVIGNMNALNYPMSVGIVGTRKPSEYGLLVTKKLAFNLAELGFAVISGCALGIDACAHENAVKAGGITVGVLGCGLDVNYPAENRQIKLDILRNKGAIISEYPPKTKPFPQNFPIRNRIISGLSLGVLITEAPIKSGALITANTAIEQGRDVFCVPPRDIFDKSICGVVKYLRDGAIPVFSVEDIVVNYFMNEPDVELVQTLYHKYAFNNVSRYQMDDNALETKPKSASNQKVKSKKTTQEDALNSQGKKQDKNIIEEDKTKINEDNNDVDISMLPEEQQQILEYIKDEPKSANLIVDKFNIPAYKVMILLSELEINGLCTNKKGLGYISII